ncbi:MAG TPA: MmcQ/YjbR family DNA-binding protein [Planctomycetota bacterium]|nr:MmcQ/YjbR family DNA-binding protein [Planctomycetota bacterium]
MIDDPALVVLRELALALPETRETTTFGHPTFQVGTKTFAVLDEYRGLRCIAFKAERAAQRKLLRDARYFRAPFGGSQGWTCLTIGEARPGAAIRIRRPELRRLLHESWMLFANGRQRAALASPTSRPKARSTRK